MSLGLRIREARKSAGWTQEELAKKCGVATITIRQYELGKREPRREVLKKIADLLDVSTGYLEGYEEINSQKILEALRSSDFRTVEKLSGVPSGSIAPLSDAEKHSIEESFNQKRSRIREINIPTDIDPEWAELEGKMKAGTATDEEASRFMELIENSKKLIPEVLKRLEKIQGKLGALEELNRILDSVEKATPEELNKIARLSEALVGPEPSDDKK